MSSSSYPSSFTATGESVYGLLPAASAVEEKDALYRSKFPGDLPPTGSTFGLRGTSKTVANVAGDFLDPDATGSNHTVKRASAHFGPCLANNPDYTSKPDPRNFTRKHQNDIVLPPKNKFVYADEYNRKPPVPKASDEKPVMGLKSDKNFVVANAVDAILAAPGKKSSEEQRWTQKPEYGQTPAYLQEVKKQISTEYEQVRAIQQSQQSAQRETMRLLSQEEKDELIAGLKHRWEEIMQHFQTISFTMHTSTQKESKNRDEKELAAIEKEIERLQKKEVWVLDG